MRNPDVPNGFYRVGDLPGGALIVRVVASLPGGGAGGPEGGPAAREAQSLGRIAERMRDPLRDLRYGLDAAARDGGFRGAITEQFARQAAAAERDRAAVVDAARPAASGNLSPAQSARLAEVARTFDGGLHRLVGPILDRTRDQWLRAKAGDLDRLDGEFHDAYERLRNAPAENPRGGEAAGFDRLRTFALAARLRSYVARLVTGLEGQRGWRPAPRSVRRAAERTLDAARGMEDALADAAPADEVADGEAQFDAAWSDWKARARAAFDRDDPALELADQLDAVHRRLHPRVRGEAAPDPRGRLETEADRLARAASVLAREAGRYSNKERQGEIDAGLDRVAAVADFYRSIVRSAGVGDPNEVRARQSLRRAIDAVDQAVERLAERRDESGRRGQLGRLSQELLQAERAWLDRVSRLN